MTDSVSITLDLTSLPLSIRQMVPVIIGTNVDQFGEIYKRGIRPIKRPSPLAGTEMMWIVRAKNERICGEDLQVASSIDADLNLPNATTGHNLEHGTSVYAAGNAALWFLKIWLAEAGLPRQYLDQLGTTMVTLRAATLTYLMRFMSAEEAKQFVQDMRVTGKILDKGTKFFDSTNETVKMPTKCGWLATYYKTVLEHCRFPEGAPEREIIAANQLIARIESLLSQAFLRGTKLDKLDSWKDGYASGLYERLFQQTVVDPMRLNLRHNSPRPEVFAKLTPTVAAFLQWYLDGKDPRQFASVVESAYPSDAYSKLRLPVLAEGDVDTNIPWEDHVRLRCYQLKDVLVYPGDYHPPVERAAWCFCQENWSALLERLKACYNSAFAEAPVFPTAAMESEACLP